MSRVIVSIVSEQTAPNYLFIKEKYEEGDELLFISSDKFKSNIDLFSKVLGKAVDSVILAPDAEEKWNEMKKALEEHLCDEKEYLVNLTGGTKYMTLLVYSVFEKKNSSFYYIPLPKNVILRPGQDGWEGLKYRMTVENYFKIHGVIDNNQGNVYALGKKPVKTEEYTEKFFDKFINDEVDFNVRTDLQAYRGIKKDKKHLNDIIKGEYKYDGTVKFPEIENIREFLEEIEFPLECREHLLKTEIDYLTGGWFEEYIYHRIKRDLNPDSIKLNIAIKESNNVNPNELDVVFTLGNKLFVIECKTGLKDKNGKNLFKEICYKASTVKDTTLGRLSAISYIISLSKDSRDNYNKETAKKMGINYKCRDEIVDERLWNQFIEEIKGKAYLPE